MDIQFFIQLFPFIHFQLAFFFRLSLLLFPLQFKDPRIESIYTHLNRLTSVCVSPHMYAQKLGQNSIQIRQTRPEFIFYFLREILIQSLRNHSLNDSHLTLSMVKCTFHSEYCQRKNITQIFTATQNGWEGNKVLEQDYHYHLSSSFEIFFCTHFLVSN